MRQALMFSAAAAMLVGLVGCACTGSQCGPSCMTGTCYDAPETCAGCGGCNTCQSSGGAAGGMLGGGLHSRGAGGVVCDPACGNPCGMLGCLLCNRRPEQCNPGPPAGAIAYPYYTTHGPRDFFASDPRSLGP